MLEHVQPDWRFGSLNGCGFGLMVTIRREKPDPIRNQLLGDTMTLLKAVPSAAYALIAEETELLSLCILFGINARILSMAQSTWMLWIVEIEIASGVLWGIKWTYLDDEGFHEYCSRNLLAQDMPVVLQIVTSTVAI